MYAELLAPYLRSKLNNHPKVIGDVVVKDDPVTSSVVVIYNAFGKGRTEIIIPWRWMDQDRYDLIRSHVIDSIDIL